MIRPLKPCVPPMKRWKTKKTSTSITPWAGAESCGSNRSASMRRSARRRKNATRSPRSKPTVRRNRKSPGARSPRRKPSPLDGGTNLRTTWLHALACSVMLAASSEAGAYPQIDFQAESSRFAAATAEYREIWQTEGERISAALETVTGLEMEAGPIRAIVYEGISNSGYRHIPMRMRASYPPDTKRATLVHELAHRLISGYVSKEGEDHPIIFLFVYDVWVKLWGQEFADAQVAVESKRTGVYDYAGAWRDA